MFTMLTRLSRKRLAEAGRGRYVYDLLHGGVSSCSGRSGKLPVTNCLLNK